MKILVGHRQPLGQLGQQRMLALLLHGDILVAALQVAQVGLAQRLQLDTQRCGLAGISQVTLQALQLLSHVSLRLLVGQRQAVQLLRQLG